MKLVPVRSSNIEAVGYDPATRTMGVRFKGGMTYHHLDVSPEAHGALMSAPSKGAHYHQNVKGKFVTKKLVL